MDEITGVVKKIIFSSKDTGFTVAKFKDEEIYGQVTITGNFLDLKEGENLKLFGDWVEHEKYGEQFKVKNYETVEPTSKSDILNYLSSGVIKGIGPAVAGLIVDKFGEDSLKVIEEEPEKLLDIRGIGKSKLKDIKKSFNEKRSMQNLYILSEKFGMSQKLMQRIFNRYGTRTQEIIRDDPYKIALEMPRVGFKTMDKIAENAGVKKEDQNRILAGLRYILSSCYYTGDCFFNEEDLVYEASELLEIEEDTVRLNLPVGIIEGHLISDSTDFGPVYYPKEIYNAENNSAFKLAKVLQEKIKRNFSVEDIKEAERALGITLDPVQKKAVLKAFNEPVSIITGGPGTGKSATSLVVKSCYV